jgi:hypothetical protein
MSNKFTRKAGAFDRFNSFQVDGEGHRVLSRDPATRHDEIRDIYARNDAANRNRVIRMERELVRQQMHKEQQLVRVALKAEYKRMIKEATEQGFLSND